MYHGIRTRARITRRTLAGPDATDALALAAVVSRTVAAAVFVAVIVGVSLLGQPVFYRYSERGYPPLIRVGVGLVPRNLPCCPGVYLGGWPAHGALACRDRGARAIALSTSGPNAEKDLLAVSDAEAARPGSHPSGTPVVNRPSRTMSPTVGAVLPISRAMSASRQPRARRRDASCFCSCVRIPATTLLL